MLLSVHGKTSRLAVLGDLGRHPMHVRALQSCLSYRHSLNNKPGNSLVSLAMKEMSVLAGQGKDCWLTRVQSMERLLRLPTTGHRLYGKKIGRHIKTCFGGTWLEQIKSVKPGPDGVNHNKLSTYNQFKGCFSIEPHLVLVRNRNQRADLTRLRVSAHCLGVERLRYTRPPTPLDQRGCRFCGPPGPRVAIGCPGRGPIDDEQHAITACSLLEAERSDLFKEMSSINPAFQLLSSQQKFVRLLCPVSPTETKNINRFISKTFYKRKLLDENIVG